jgi:hypothetical protein
LKETTTITKDDKMAKFNTSYLETEPAPFAELQALCLNASKLNYRRLHCDYSSVEVCRAGIVEFQHCIDVDGTSTFAQTVELLATISYENFLDLQLNALEASFE